MISSPTQPSRIVLDSNKLSNASTCIAELNKRFAVVSVGGKTVVLDEAQEPLVYKSFADFERLYCNVLLMVNKKVVKLGKHWLEDPSRRQYSDGVFFEPGTAVSTGDRYNLWRGFDVDPDKTKVCQLFLSHARSVICGGNDDRYEYLLNWLALMVQRPGELPGVAIGLLSAQGTGKGLFVSYVGKMLGRHYKHIADKSHLLGNFSGHLQDAVLVFADELSWSGNSDDAGLLKALITEPVRMIEKKFADAFPVKNCTHLIVASNNSWAIPAEIGDRRYCVFDVSSEKCGEVGYFDRLADEMKSGGPDGLLYFLQQRDISGFVPSRFPRTDARVNQQIQTLPKIEKWLFDCLCMGQLTKDEEDWPASIRKTGLFEVFCAWCDQQGERRHKPTMKGFTTALSKYGIETSRQPTGSRQYIYLLPPLDVVRESFSKILGGEVDWS